MYIPARTLQISMGLIVMLTSWLLALARFAGMLAMRAWSRVRMWKRARHRENARRSARALVDCARARCAIASIGDATFDVTEIYNCLVDQGAMSVTRMRAALIEALVDEVDEESASSGVVIAKFGWRHEGITARMSLSGDDMMFDIRDGVLA